MFICSKLQREDTHTHSTLQKKSTALWQVDRQARAGNHRDREAYLRAEEAVEMDE